MTGVGGPSGGWRIQDGEGRRREAFDALIDDALDRIPPPFRDRLDTVAVVAEDEPGPGQAPPGQTLFGLLQGVPRTAWGKCVGRGTIHNMPIAKIAGPRRLLS